MPSKRVLITGGGGQLGANLARYYLERGYRVSLLLEANPEVWNLFERFKLQTQIQKYRL